MTLMAAAVLAAAGVFSSQSYDKPMEIGNYDVTIDLPAGKSASVNYVKFMGRRLAIDRTELKAGEKKSVSFELTKEQLMQFGMDGKQSLAKGEYSFFVGGGQPGYDKGVVSAKVSF